MTPFAFDTGDVASMYVRVLRHIRQDAEERLDDAVRQQSLIPSLDRAVKRLHKIEVALAEGNISEEDAAMEVASISKVLTA